MKQKIIYTFVIALLFLNACGSHNDQNQGTSIAGNSTAPLPTITIGKLTSDGKATITMPLAVFGGSEDNLVGATIDVSVNGTLRYDNIDPVPQFHSDSETVIFTLANLQDGDALTFVVTVQSNAATYEGTVSGDEETEATNALFGSTSSSTGVSPNISIVSRVDGTNEIAIAASAFGGVSAVSGATLTLTFTYGDDSTVVKTISAADYYNTLTQAVELSPSELWGIEFTWEDPTDHDVATDDSLITIDFEMRLSDGSTRAHQVGGNGIRTRSENLVSNDVGFIGTSIEKFSHTYLLAMTVSGSGSCYSAAASGGGVIYTFSVDQGMFFMNNPDAPDVGNIVGVVDEGGEFLVYSSWSLGGLSGTFEARGTISETSFNSTETQAMSSSGLESCITTTVYEGSDYNP